MPFPLTISTPPPRTSTPDRSLAPLIHKQTARRTPAQPDGGCKTASELAAPSSSTAMRPGPEFPTMSHGAPMAAAGANGTAPHSPWQSPVPYLFGGLAAMLGLIAFALLILACSYWKLSGYLDADRDQQAESSGEAGGADGEKGSAAGTARPASGFLEHVVVIMAGEQRPTFLATPVASRAVVELGAVPAAPGSSGSGEGVEKKAHVDDGEDCEQEGPRLGADADAGAGAMSRSSESSTSSEHHASTVNRSSESSTSSATALAE